MSQEIRFPVGESDESKPVGQSRQGPGDVVERRECFPRGHHLVDVRCFSRHTAQRQGVDKCPASGDQISPVAHGHDVVLVLLDSLTAAPQFPEPVGGHLRLVPFQAGLDCRTEAAGEVEYGAEEVKCQRLNIVEWRGGGGHRM